MIGNTNTLFDSGVGHGGMRVKDLLGHAGASQGSVWQTQWNGSWPWRAALEGVKRASATADSAVHGSPS